MNDILLISVGMTAAPLINCIRSQRPQRVVFLCSDATRSKVDEVLAQVPIPRFDPARDVVVLQQRRSRKEDASVINELDRLDCVYRIAWEQLQRLRREEPGARIGIDYTGGSKTMAAGLSMAAIDDGRVQVLVTTTDQRPRDGEISGATVPTPTEIGPIQVLRLLDRNLPALMERFDYGGAEALVHRVRLGLRPDEPNASTLRRLELQLQAFDAWDRFDHRQATICFEQVSHDRLSTGWLRALKRVVGSRIILDLDALDQDWPKESGHGLESVEDLLRNAERRASQERYDDAVGRLYRAMELTEQLLLKIAVTDKVGAGGIETGAVDLDRLPADIQTRWRHKATAAGSAESGKALKIGLADGYDLLADLGHPTGLEWRQRRAALVNGIKTRNESLFAHGFKPVDYSGWRDLSELLGGFLQAAIEQHSQQHSGRSAVGLTLPQFPTTLAELLPGE
jgi:CRISPR-associated protein (TIGR02710 family)